MMATAAPPALIEIARFDHKRDTRPRREQVAWDELARRFLRHTTRAAKDGPLWSPAAYPDGATRADANVIEVTALVFEFDGCAPDWNLLGGVAFLAYSTFSHLTVCEHNPSGGPCWRLVLQLRWPVPREDWQRVWRRARARYAPASDPSCSDASRMYYLPSCPPEAKDRAQAHQGAGEPVDPDALAETPEEVQEREVAAASRAAPAPGQARGGESVGDRFTRETSWAQLLEPHGWRSGGESRGQEIWRRPGRTDDHEARSANTTPDGNLWVWTSSAPPFEARRSYTRLCAHVLLEHGGDWKAAIRALAARYEDSRAAPAVELGPERTNGHAPAPDVAPPAPPDGDDEEEDDGDRAGGYARSDTGNAERLLDAYGHLLRYCEAWGKWLVWDRRRWREDPRECRVLGYARRVVRRMRREASALAPTDKEGAEALFKHALASQAAGKLAAMVQVARSYARVWVSPDDLDADPWLLNCRNGTVDLRTGELLPHAPARLMTKMAPVAYDPHAPCPAWARFVSDVSQTAEGQPDPELAAYLQRAIGHSLTGDQAEQAVYFPYGKGANGKSTLLNTVKAALGEYAMQAKDDLLMVKRHEAHPTELTDLFRKRLVVSTELEDGRRLAEALVKQMSGGEPIRARRMREDFWEFEPTHTVWIAANHKPEIRGTDHAIWRRIRLVPFDVTFYDRAADAPEGLTHRVKDTDLPARLRGELAGVLAWAVRGCLAWRREGLTVPGRVQEATAQYREEMDVLAAFLAERCEIVPQASAGATDLYRAYVAWCEANGEKAETQTRFGNRLGERGHGKTRDPAGDRIVRLGLRLRPTESEREAPG